MSCTSPNLLYTPGFCAWDSPAQLTGAMAAEGTPDLASYLAYEMGQWQNGAYPGAPTYCADWQLMQLSCLNALAGGISTDGQGNITADGTVVPGGPVGSFPAPDMMNPSAIDAGIQSQLFPTGTANTTGILSASNPAAPAPVPTGTTTPQPVSMPPAQSQVVNSTPGASIGAGQGSGAGQQTSTSGSTCFNPLSQWFTADTCISTSIPIGIFETAIAAGLLLWAFSAGGKR